MKPIVKKLLSGLSLILLLLVMALTWLATTQSGFKSSLYIANLLLAGELKVESVSGKWITTIKLKNISYIQNDTTLHIERLTATPQLSLRLNLTIDDLSLHNITLHTLEKNLITLDELQTQIFLDPKRLRLSLDTQIPMGILTPYPPYNVTLRDASFTIDGKFNDYQLSGQAYWQTNLVPNGALLFNASGDTAGIDSSTITITWGNSQLYIDGILNWQDQFDWQTQIEGYHINPAVFSHEWQGDINLVLTAQQAMLETDRILQLELETLEGTLRKVSISGQASVELTNQTLTQSNVVLNFGDATINATGTTIPYWDIHWQIAIPQLRQLWPGAKGRINSTGIIHGDQENPIVTATAELKDIAWRALLIDNLTLNNQLDFAEDGQFNSSLIGENISYNGWKINTVKANIQGNPKQHEVFATLQEHSNDWQLHLSASFLDSLTWNSNIEVFNLASSIYGDWTLSKGVELTIDWRSIIVSDTCWFTKNSKKANAKQRICFGGRWDNPHNWQYTLNADNVDIGLFSDIIYPDIQLDGSLSLIGHGEKTREQLDVDMKATINNGLLTYTTMDDEHISQAFNLDSSINFNKHNGHGQVNIYRNDTNYLIAELDFPHIDYQHPLADHQPLAGQVKLAFDELDWLELLTIELDNIKGHATGYFDIEGTIAKPLAIGTFNIHDAQFDISELGITVTESQLALTTTEKQAFAYEGKLYTDEGYVSFFGNTYYEDEHWLSRIKVRGENFHLSDTSLANIWATPNLNITIDDQDISISGKLHIPKAILNPLDYSSIMQASDDIVYHHIDIAPTAILPWQVKASIDLTLADNIEVSLGSLTATLGGTLHINEIPGQPTTATGELHVVKGQFSILGQQLAIDKGELYFSKSLIDNPSINIRASRTFQLDTSNRNQISDPTTSGGFAQELIAGVLVQGTVNNPEIEFFSQPTTLEQADIVSLLLIGQTTQNLSGNENQILLGILMSNLDEGGGITSIIKEGLGLEELTIGTTETFDQKTGQVTQTTSLILGRYLTPKLYVSYNLGITDPVNSLILKYFFKPRWVLQTETSTDRNSVDVYYTFER